MQIALQEGKILLANKAVDFRKSVNTLCTYIIEEMKDEPGKGIYIFYNKNLDRVKILGWHRNGFVLIYKRLEEGKFFIHNKVDNLAINSAQLNCLLIGVDWKLLSEKECKFNAYF
jgi:transposase